MILKPTIKTKSLLLRLFKTLLIGYLCLCLLLYFFQERFIFFPEKLDKTHQFSFNTPFWELTFETPDGVLLNGLLFKADTTKGLVFFLHGNAGSLQRWGSVANAYTALHYDLFIPDYRGYGKSTGTISGEQQIYDDVQLMYNELKKKYSENKIVLSGYSIGTGPATYLAANNNPRLLLLHAPYYNLTAMLRHYYPLVPSVLLKYKFKTNELLKNCTMPVIIFHGNADKVIPYNSSLQLQKHFKKQDTLITLINQTHNGITENSEYIKALQKILN